MRPQVFAGAGLLLANPNLEEKKGESYILYIMGKSKEEWKEVCNGHLTANVQEYIAAKGAEGKGIQVVESYIMDL